MRSKGYVCVMLGWAMLVAGVALMPFSSIAATVLLCIAPFAVLYGVVHS